MSKILVIDDNEAILKTLQELFKFFHYEVITAVNGKEGIKMAELHHPDLIILDALMPEMNGFDTCKYLKSHIHLKNIPVIFLSANYTDEDSRILGLELGADDYLLKPFNTRELVAKVKTLLKRKYVIDNLRAANQELLRVHERIKRELESAKLSHPQDTLLKIDPVTGIYNKNYFLQMLKHSIEISIKEKTPFTLAVIDIENMDTLQEIFEDSMFNYLLIKIVNLILKNLKDNNRIGQIFQNRFAIIFPESSSQNALYLVEKIRASLSDSNLIEQIIEEVQAPLKKKKNFKPLLMSAVILEHDPELFRDHHKFFRTAMNHLDLVIEKGGNKTKIIDKSEIKME